MASSKGLKKQHPGVYYKEHPSRKRDAINKDRLWVIVQRLGGIRRVSTLGWEKLDKITEGDAINKALFYKSNFKWNTTHPLEPQKPICKTDEDQTSKQAEINIPLLSQFIKRYLTHYAQKNLKPTTYKEYLRQIESYILPELGHRRIIDIQKKHIIKLIEQIGERAPIMANRVLATVKSIFTYALDVDIISTSPAVGIKPIAKENVRTRILDLDEIAKLFKICETYHNRTIADILRLIILTGMRPGEVLLLRFEHIKKESTGYWIKLEREETKNSLERRIYLNNLAYSIIQNRKKKINLTEYLFPNKSGTGHILIDTLSHKISKIRTATEEAGIKRFTAHDLRRSAATGIAKLGYWSIVPDILGHKPQGVTRKHYDQYSREPEIKKALEAWGLTIENSLNNERANNVIPLST
jgi:integrase